MMKERAVIDRFEDGWAVLLIGDEERKLDVPRESLPQEARERHWLLVELEGDELISAEIDQGETDTTRQRIRSKLDRLRRGEHRQQ